MKAVILSVWCLLAAVAQAADTSLVFRKIEYADVWKAARKENKAVMLYFHYDGCGACTKMEQTAFKDPKVIDYYNRQFVCFEVNTRKGKGIDINKTYQVQLHPTFILLDETGKELHRMVGVYTPEAFYKHASEALQSDKSVVSYRRRYHAGNREPAFFREYIYLLRDAYQLDSALLNEYLATQTTEELGQEYNIRLVYEFMIHRSNTYIPYNSRAYRLMMNRREQFGRYVDSAQVTTRLMFATLTAVYNAIEQKDSATFETALESLRSFESGQEYQFKEMDNRITMWTGKYFVLPAQMDFYSKMGDAKRYAEAADAYARLIWDQPSELNTFAWGVFLQADPQDSVRIATAIRCSIRSIALQNNYANNDTYAWLLHKAGQFREARVQAEKAIAIAKEQNEKYNDTQKLIDQLNTEGK